MNNKNLTPAQQIYAKVCDIEKKLDQLLQQKAVPAPEAERRIYLAAAGPDLPLSVIQLEDAPDYLPCFEESDMLYALPGEPQIGRASCRERV